MPKCRVIGNGFDWQDDDRPPGTSLAESVIYARQGFVLAHSRAAASHAGLAAGSSNLFAHDGRAPQASINAVAMHDGLTLADLVASAEGESGDDRDADSGAGGEPEKSERYHLAALLARNLLATTLLSLGVPMFLAGDEFGQSQGGDDNAYNQNNETAWLDWANAGPSLRAFTRRLLALRRAHPGLRRRGWLRGERNGDDEKNVVWLGRDGGEKSMESWGDPGDRLSSWQGDNAWLIVIQDEDAPLDFFPAGQWWRIIDTARPEITDEIAIGEPACGLEARSLALFRRSD